MTDFPDWLAHRAGVAPKKLALVASGNEWTFGGLDAAATRAAHRLADAGVRPGDRVASFLGNGAGAVILVHAVLRLGASLVPLNVRLSSHEVAWQVGDSRPRLAVVEARTAALFASASSDCASIDVAHLFAPDDASGSPVAPEKVSSGLLAPPRSSADLIERDGSASDPGAGRGDHTLRLSHPPGHVLAVIYTSGTTGQPKAAQLTVANFWWSAIGSALNLGTDPGDRWLAVLPLYHVGGLSIAIRSAIYGVATIVHDSFDPAEANRAIDEDGATLVSVVSVMLNRMLEARGERRYPPSLRCVLLGGGPAPQVLLERCAALHVPVVQTYGLTEACSQVATLAPADAQRKLGAAGRPLYPNEVRIASPVDAPPEPGEAGEILVRGPIVMAGYAGRPDATARTIVDGWLHTGDIGSLDAEGFLHVHDRRDDLIITGGENVYPAEVESALLAHPWVAEAAVIGLPDDEWGQRVVAVVRLAGPSADAAAVLQEHCRSLVAGYKVPREVRVVTEPLPRTATGKLRRMAVRDGLARTAN